MTSSDRVRPASRGARATGTERATVAGSLRLAAGLTQRERTVLVRVLGRLDAQLARYPAGRVELEVSLRDRGTPGQRLTLECWIPGRPRLVAGSAQRHLDDAVRKACEGLRRQLDDTATRREPRNDRQRRRRPAAGPADAPGVTGAAPVPAVEERGR